MSKQDTDFHPPASHEWLGLSEDPAQSLQDATLELVALDVTDAVSSQLDTASNEVLANIAWQAYVDACDVYGIPSYEHAFAELFPLYDAVLS